MVPNSKQMLSHNLTLEKKKNLLTTLVHFGILIMVHKGNQGGGINDFKGFVGIKNKIDSL